VGGEQVVAFEEVLLTASRTMSSGEVLLRWCQCVYKVKAQCAGVRLQLRAPNCQDRPR